MDAFIALHVADAVRFWYDEIEDYDWNDDMANFANFNAIGHFTQLVWDDSVALGVAYATAVSGGFTYRH